MGKFCQKRGVNYLIKINTSMRKFNVSSNSFIIRKLS